MTGDTDGLGWSPARKATSAYSTSRAGPQLRLIEMFETVIVSTPEKFDSLTRSWHQSSKMADSIRVLCIDECHLLNEDRGATLEVLVTYIALFNNGLDMLSNMFSLAVV